MYPANDLYRKYKERLLDNEYSAELPDVTTRSTLEHINSAINLCERWDSAMDIGAGDGHYLAALASKFRKNVGVEIDKIPSQEILAKKYPNLRFFNGPIEAYPKGEHFDFVLLMDIFEHIKDVRAFMLQVADLQKKGGTAYIVTPNPVFCGPSEESQISHTHIGYHGHIKHYTRNEVIEICGAAGYAPEFSLYEETSMRDSLRRFVKGVSRRDRRLSKYALYRFFRPMILETPKAVFSIFEKKCRREEKRLEHDIYSTRSLAIAFKKK